MTTILLANIDAATQTAVYHAGNTLLDHTLSLINAESIEEAARAAQISPPDLIVLDLTFGTPDVCARFRSLSHGASTPILFVLNSGTAEEIAQVLDAGGDDCVRRPVVARELAARIRALLRRNTRTGQDSEGTLTLNMQTRTVHFGLREIELTPTEFDLLETLCRNPGKHITTVELLTQVWHYPKGQGDPALVRNHVRNLRRKLEIDPDKPKIVTSFHGRGYTISATVVAH